MKILVIGSGIAGLGFALKAAEFAEVIIVTKKELRDCNSYYAQGGLAAVFDKNDNFELHIKDTLRAGDGLCNEDAVKLVVSNAPKQILWLKKQGVKFDKQLSKEAVHSRARIVHSGDITGERIEEVLIANIKKNPKIKVYEDAVAVELLKEENRCVGAVILKGDKTFTICAGATVLATGGLGRLYKNTCNPDVATGDGFTLAYNAGAELEDMEFVQFHPTGLYNTPFLISETLRGEGGHLLNNKGEIYMPKYHRDGELAPRDVVSKFTVDEMKKTNTDHVHLDVTHLGADYLKKRFPRIYARCLEQGVDLTKEPIPVTPTAHYSCGGVKINLKAETTIPGLYAIGEASCSGFHGADRLASNSLTDCLVFGHVLADNLRDKNHLVKECKDKQFKIVKYNNNTLKKEIQSIMWDKVGIIRTETELGQALKRLETIKKELDKVDGISHELVELRDMVTASIVITKCALARKESRGTHFLREYPKRDDERWKKHSVISLGGLYHS
ncbi:MAG: L-aspartate oxidase [Nanoarchaeota archaeon]|nr:L-aspartate oxidase [Nanoarchaeota archaeon]MBU1705078.1 L-aspartate oxidase [Nanoarchaeota archaeon]